MTILGNSDSVFWKASDNSSMLGVSADKVVDLNVITDPPSPLFNQVGYTEKHFCMFNEEDDRGIAWIDESVTPRHLHVVYLTSDEIAVGEHYDVALPTFDTLAGMAKVSKYVYRILTGTGLVWTFREVTVNTGAIASGSSYTFTWNYDATVNQKVAAFYANTRSDHYILGLQFEYTQYESTVSWPTTHYSRVYLAGIIADIAYGSFGSLSTMLDMTDYPSYYTLMTAGICMWHWGDSGFFVRACILETYWDQTQAGGYQTWYLDEMKLTEFVWQGSLTDQSYGGTVIGDTVYSPHKLYRTALYPPYYYPNTGVCGYTDAASGQPWPLNSYLNWSEAVATIYIPASSAYETIDVRPWGGYTPDMDGSKPLSETGNQLMTYTFEMTSDPHAYLANSGGVGTQLAESGYEILGQFNRLDSDTHYILCWANRTSDSYSGIAIFDQSCIFVDFIPLLDYEVSLWGGLGWFLIASGFIVVGDYGFYIGGLESIINNILYMIPEQN